MTRAQVIEDLMDCLESITAANGFNVQPAKVLRGVHLVSELKQLPGLSLMNQRVETGPLAAGLEQRTLWFHLWGAARAARGDYTGLDRLAAACAAALANPELNPHWDRTRLGVLEVFEGGAGDPVGLFDLELSVDYEAEPGVL